MGLLLYVSVPHFRSLFRNIQFSKEYPMYSTRVTVTGFRRLTSSGPASRSPSDFYLIATNQNTREQNCAFGIMRWFRTIRVSFLAPSANWKRWRTESSFAPPKTSPPPKAPSFTRRTSWTRHALSTTTKRSTFGKEWPTPCYTDFNNDIWNFGIFNNF